MNKPRQRVFVALAVVLVRARFHLFVTDALHMFKIKAKPFHYELKCVCGSRSICVCAADTEKRPMPIFYTQLILSAVRMNDCNFR